MTSTWETYLDHNRDRFQSELLDFLRIPSISSLPTHAEDVVRAAKWVAQRLQAASLEGVCILPTGGHPVVYGEWLHAADQPTILIYGHFDTQPADPLELWTTPPFEPTIRENCVFARGASDDKGNMLAPILALEALLKTDGTLPVNVKVFFEGQEEIGSPQLSAFIAAHAALLTCDLVVSSDGGQWDEQHPALFVGMKGLSGIQIDVRGASSDLHSGLYGGVVSNAAHALIHILASMRGPQGEIVVDGFYDQVTPLTPTDRAAIAAVPFDEMAYRDQLHVAALIGEPGYTPLERLWARPTLEINGMWSGFQGDGIKTVLPGDAHAKITCRLVPAQDPETIAQTLMAHIERHTPPGVRLTVSRLPGRAIPYLMPIDHWGNRAAADVLTDLYGTPPYYARSGGSIPVCELFLRHLQAYTISFAFGLPDEQLHAPNEYFRLASFATAQVAYGKLLHRLAQHTPTRGA